MRASVLVLGAMAVAGCISRTLVLPPSAHLRAGSEPADLVVLDARVFTSEQASPWAEAVAARDGRLVYVGTSRGAAVHVGPDTRVIDAGGRLLTPGFVDNHCHFLWLGYLKPLLVDLYDKELPQMRAAIRAFADQHPDHPFLLGVGWTPAAIGKELPRKELLDTIEAQRPVFLWSNGGQEGWVNSAALELMRERKPEVFAQLGPLPNPAEPDGTFDQFHAFNPFDFFRRDELPKGLEEQLLGSVKKQLASALSYGVTAFDDAQVHDTFLSTLLELRRRGAFADIRARGSLYVGPHRMDNPEAFRELLVQWRNFGSVHADGHFWMGDSVKMYVDGVYLSRTAWLHEPYVGHPQETGSHAWRDPERFARAVEIVDAMGIQACTHAVGDRGITALIDAYENAQRRNGTRDARHRADHCELPTPADQARMAALGIHAAMHPAHFVSDRATEEILGPARMRRMMPWASLERAGVEVSFGSDWLAGPENPLYGILIAATRLNYKLDTDWGKEERIPLAEAVRNYTLGSARALKREREIGSLAVGKYADFVLFDWDFLAADPKELLLAGGLEEKALDRLVLLTVVDGRVVYHRQGLRF